MNLTAKFNLIIVSVLLVSIGLAGLASYHLLQQNARAEVINQARIIVDAASSIRGYTIKQIRPILREYTPHEEFFPQGVPAFATTEILSSWRAEHSEYGYKEATLNPTNPRDRAVDWETDIVESFRNDTQLDELIGERQASTGLMLYLARPLQVKNESCLSCHGLPEAAPDNMIKRYGSANGFGWQMNEIIGAQIITVPMSLPIKNAQTAFQHFMLSLFGVFLVILIALNVLLRWLVIKPIVNMSNMAEKVSRGAISEADFNIKSKDEIGKLNRSFHRMHQSLNKAMKMLDI